MSEFPRTTVGGLSLPRMLIGTNWFLGFSHQSSSKDKQINALTVSQVADILEVFLSHGIDAVVGFAAYDKLYHAIKEAEDRTGKGMILLSTPGIDTGDGPEAEAKNAEIFDLDAKRGTSICMPHCSSTDELLDKRRRCIHHMEKVCAMIREREMIPGLSTHMPETIVIADESGLDVATYISIYNAVGFLMPLEIEWVNHIIRNAAQPVITIKPFAAGRLQPFVGLAFSWATLRPQDMVAVGTFSPDEAKELIELSYACFERRQASIELQETRSKKGLKAKAKS